MVRWLTAGLACTLFAVGCHRGPKQSMDQQVVSISAERMADLGSIGFAGPFVGESNGVLLAGGGTNFPVDPPWKQGKKVWYDEVHALIDGAWKPVGKLPKPNAVGASVTTQRGVMVIGGGDADEVFADVFLMRYEQGALAVEPLPPLPKPIMGSAAVVLGERVYVVGGHSEISPMTNGPLADVWSLSIADPSSGWRAEPPIPGPGRWLPVVGADNKSLLVMSGMTPRTGADGKKAIHCLSDVWRYTPGPTGNGDWTQLSDLPRAHAAAPTPAPSAGGEVFILGGGVDDSNFGKPMDQRPPFPSTITAVNIETGAARVAGSVESSVVAVNVSPYRGGWAVVTGEVRAGVRSPTVWVYRLQQP